MFQNRVTSIAFLFVVLAAGLLYSQTLTFEFVYDDNDQVLNNPWIRDLSNVKTIFLNDAWAFASDASPSHYYRPLMHLTYMVIYVLAGHTPWAFHLWSVILHAFNVCLVFAMGLYISKWMTAGRGGPESFGSVQGLDCGRSDRKQEIQLFGLSLESCQIAAVLAALVFAFHPINTEPVSWVAAVSELYYTTGFLLLAVLEFSRQPSLVRSTLGAVACLMALLSKETAVVFPLILIGIRWVQERTFKNVYLYVPYVVVMVVYLYLRQMAIQGGLGVDLGSINWPMEWINACRNFALYLWKLVFPHDLSVIYQKNWAQSITEKEVLLSLFLILGIGFCLIIYRKNKIMVFSSVWVIAPIFVALFSSLVSSGGFADRYLYCSTVGFAILLAHVGVRLLESMKPTGKVILISVFAAYICVLGSASFVRAKVWQNDVSLFSDAVLKSPQDINSRGNLGNAYLVRKNYAMARSAYEIALEINPRHPGTLFNLGLCYENLGMPYKAIEVYRLFLQYAPPAFDVHSQKLIEKFPVLRQAYEIGR